MMSDHPLDKIFGDILARFPLPAGRQATSPTLQCGITPSATPSLQLRSHRGIDTYYSFGSRNFE
jgi:hypothetical protein